MHYHLHYKSSRPEIRRIGEKLESESGNEHVAHAQQFYWAQKGDI